MSAARSKWEQGKLDDPIATLNGYLACKPNSTEGYTLPQQIYWRKNDLPSYRNAAIKLCQLHLNAHEADATLQDYQEFAN